MKYFVQLEGCSGTCYHEFYKGKWDEESFWENDSLYIHDDFIFTLKIEDIFLEVNSTYDPFGETIINQEQWKQVLKIAEELGGEVKKAINEADEWARSTFEEYDSFTILDI